MLFVRRLLRVLGGLGGDPRLKSGEHLLELLLHCRRYTREISNFPSTGSALFTMDYAYAQMPEISPSCTELVTRVMRTTPKDITRTFLGSKTQSWALYPKFYNRPRPIVLGRHGNMYIPCGAAMAPWLLRYPRCPLKYLHIFLCFL